MCITCIWIIATLVPVFSTLRFQFICFLEPPHLLVPADDRRSCRFPYIFSQLPLFQPPFHSPSLSDRFSLEPYTMNNIASNLDRLSRVTTKSINTNNDSDDSSSEAQVHGQPQEFAEKRDSMSRDTLLAFGPRRCISSPCMVTLSPQAVAQLQARYIGLQQTGSLNRDIAFEQFLSVFLSKRRGENYVGLDDGKTTLGPSTEAQLIDKPPRQLRGVVHTLVLLVDFSDKPHDGNHVTSYYDTMLFSAGTFPTGSMRDYYKKISGFTTLENPGIDIQGEVYGWFRMPQPLSYYAGGNSGLGTFPNNAQGFARDAVKAALDAGVKFAPSGEPNRYDAYRENEVTALFIVHAGQGAEQTLSPNDIWSLKWGIPSAAWTWATCLATTSSR